MPFPTAAETVREFWRLMATNDFASVAAVLAKEFVRAKLNEVCKRLKAT